MLTEPLVDPSITMIEMLGYDGDDVYGPDGWLTYTVNTEGGVSISLPVTQDVFKMDAWTVKIHGAM